MPNRDTTISETADDAAAPGPIAHQVAAEALAAKRAPPRAEALAALLREHPDHVDPSDPIAAAVLAQGAQEYRDHYYGDVQHAPSGLDPNWLAIRERFVEIMSLVDVSFVYDDPDYGLSEIEEGQRFHAGLRDQCHDLRDDALYFPALDMATLADKESLLSREDYVDEYELERVIDANRRRLQRGSAPTSPSPIAHKVIAEALSPEKAKMAQSLDEAIAAFEAFEPEYQRLRKAHNAAEEAALALPDHGVAPPAALTVTSDPLIIKSKNREFPVGPWTFTYKTEEAINSDAGLAPERKAEMLAALAVWEAEIDRVERANGTRKLVEARRRADKAWQRASDRRRKLGFAILEAPVYTAAELDRQLRAFAKSEDAASPAEIYDDAAMTMALAATARALKNMSAPASPMPPAGFQPRGSTACAHLMAAE